MKITNLHNVLLIILGSALWVLASYQPIAAQELTGQLEIKGSGTLYPLTKAVADFYKKLHPQVSVSVEPTGTSDGLAQFVNGSVDITNASRPIHQNELKELGTNGIEFLEVPVVFGAITLIKNNNNTFLTDVTISEINQIFSNKNTALRWNDIRPEWPNEPIVVYGPNDTHGTYDFFRERILNKDESFRSDYNDFQEYSDIIDQVNTRLYSIGYVGVANYNTHNNEVAFVPLRYGDEVVSPTYINIKKERYKVLSRKMYLYINHDALDRPEVQKFLEMYMKSASLYSSKLGFIPFDDAHYKQQLQRIAERKKGFFSDTSS